MEVGAAMEEGGTARAWAAWGGVARRERAAGVGEGEERGIGRSNRSSITWFD